MLQLFDIALGAALVGVAWLLILAGKHGWTWVAAFLKARAARLEAAAQAELAALTAPFEARLKAAEDAIGTLQKKLGNAPPAPAAQAAPVAVPAAGGAA